MTTTTGMTFVHAAHLLAAHLAHHVLPEPASLAVMTRAGKSVLTVQVRSDTVPSVATELLAWADTLRTVTVGVWRTPVGDRVHLSITSTVNDSAGAVALDVYGGADHNPGLFADLAPSEHRDVSLEQLRTWAATATDPTGGGGAA
jgi:hypothetical protein